MIFKLDDVCLFYNGGAWSDKEYVANGLPVLKVTNCKPNGFNLDNISFLPYSSAEKYSKNKLHRKDVIIATVGSHPNLVDSAAGRSCIVNSLVEGYYLNQNAVCMRTKDESIVDQDFLGYLSKNESFQHYIQVRGRGAANQMRIAISSIKGFEFDFPDIVVQRKIAKVLFSYDDFIENNQKQIKLLEEAAQRLYKEWFIDLHFPGYENTTIIDGTPEGWKKRTIGEFIAYEIGGGWGEETPQNKAEDGAFVVRGTDLYGLTHGQLTEIPFRYHATKNLASRKMEDGDIIFEVSGGSKTEGVARTALIKEEMLDFWKSPVMCASFCKLIRPISAEYSQYLFNTFQYLRATGRTGEYDKKSASSIVNYRWKDFLSQEIIYKPDDNIIHRYNQIVEPIYKEIIIKSLQIQTACQTRDRLLPKLMNEEIEVLNEN